MKIILANPRGFCAGVNMAIESLEQALALVRQSDLRLSRDRPQPARRRALPRAAWCSSMTSPKCLPAARCSTAPTASRRSSAQHSAERNLRAIDATCPLVTKVHMEAVRFARKATRSCSSATKGTTR